jgi:Lrp/AsnC family transcriptional regulator, leucine-responsive regulatory protein
MDDKDQQILRVLQADGRISNQDLAERVHLSPSPCLRRLRNLEDRGVIRGYAADVDAKACGLPLTAYIRISLSQHSQEFVRGFETRVQRLDEVMECHLMTCGSDYLLRVMVSGLDTYENFIRHSLQPIPGIASIDSSFVYGTVKKTNVFPHQ